MRLRSLWLLCAAVGAYAMVSDAYGQVRGSLDKSSAFAAEQANREAEEQQALQVAQKEALAESIIAREEMDSGRAFDPAFRAGARKALASLSLAALEVQKSAAGLGVNNLGDTQADLVYAPLTPCRIIDTRLAGGAIGAGETRDFLVTGTNLSSQGGSATGCGVPFGPATAAVINLVAVDAAGRGNLQVTPFGTAIPLASIINYTAGFNIANGPAVAVCDPSATTCTKDITIQANNSVAHLVADVQGFFRKVRKEQVKSTHAVSRTGETTAIGATCTNYSGGTITVTAPVAGRIAVRANVDVYLNHVSGTYSLVDVTLGTTATDCAGVWGYDESAHMPAEAPTSVYWQWVHPSKEFSVAAGTYTYYINGFPTHGTGHQFWWGALEATFIPN